MTNWKTIYSSSEIKPMIIDETSSEYFIYERKNIHQEKVKDENTSERLQWVYEERIYSRKEWEDLQSPMTKSIMQAISNIELSVAMLGGNEV